MRDYHYYLQQLWYYLNIALDFILGGFHEGFGRVNGALLGLIIALFGAYFLHDWRKRIFAITLGATLFFLIAQVMLPVLANNASFRLPSNMTELSYWRAAIAQYLGFFLIISVFYFIKTRVIPGGKH